MKLPPHVSILGAALLAGCALVPQPIAQHEGATVTLRPALQGGAFRTQTVIAPYGQADINHLVVKVFKLVNGSEVAVQDGQGNPLQKDIPNTSLGNPVAFGNLHHDTTYRFRAYAYGDAATTTLISTTDAGSYAEVAVARNDRPTLATLPVKLIDKTFNGQATASIVVIDGGLASSGSEGFGYVQVYPSGYSTTFAGSPGVVGATDGSGATARFRKPFGVTLDASGNLFVTDRPNQNIRKITPEGVVTSFAGYVLLGGSQDGIGTMTTFRAPAYLAADPSGNLFVADYDNHTIRKITPAGVVTTFAGLAGSSGTSDGTGTDAKFNHPSGIAVDSSSNVYVTDSSSTIRKITPGRVVTTLVGTTGSNGSVDGTGTAAKFQWPSAMALDGLGNLYVADTNNQTIRKVVLATKEVTTVAGTPGTVGSADGVSATFNYPYGLAMDGSDTLFVSEMNNHTIRKITLSTGEVTTFAGQAGVTGSADGAGADARFYSPYGIAVDSARRYLYVTDHENSTVRKITL